jgi:hypothetical protein
LWVWHVFDGFGGHHDVEGVAHLWLVGVEQALLDGQAELLAPEARDLGRIDAETGPALRADGEIQAEAEAAADIEHARAGAAIQAGDRADQLGDAGAMLQVKRGATAGKHLVVGVVGRRAKDGAGLRLGEEAAVAGGAIEQAPGAWRLVQGLEIDGQDRVFEAGRAAVRAVCVYRLACCPGDLRWDGP